MTQRKILLVDDEPSMLSFLQVLFDDAGYDTICASEGTEGLREFFVYRPDVAIVDLLMPEVDGFAVLEWIQEHGAALKIPVVVLTSSENPEHEERSLALGAHAFFKKPADLDQLGEVVREIVAEWVDDPSLSAPLQSAG